MFCFSDAVFNREYFYKFIDPKIIVNISGSTTNCYYCTVAALLGFTTAQLHHICGVAERDGASRDRIGKLFRIASGSRVECKLVSDSELKNELAAMPPKSSLGFTYYRSAHVAHMIAIIKDDFDTVKFVDYQKIPPSISYDMPRGYIHKMYLYFRRS